MGSGDEPSLPIAKAGSILISMISLMRIGILYKGIIC
jgi:hypothetical protein